MKKKVFEGLEANCTSFFSFFLSFFSFGKASGGEIVRGLAFTSCQHGAVEYHTALRGVQIQNVSSDGESKCV